MSERWTVRLPATEEQKRQIKTAALRRGVDLGEWLLLCALAVEGQETNANVVANLVQLAHDADRLSQDIGAFRAKVWDATEKLGGSE